MATRKRDKAKQEEIAQELTRKEQRLRQRDRERHRKLYIFMGVVLGLVVILIVVGVVYQFLYVPGSTAAAVGDTPIVTSDFWKRAKYDKFTMESQLAQYQRLEQQFGGQGFFQSQISQLQSTLASPFALGQQSLDNMIEDILIAQEAKRRSISVSDQEVEDALRAEVANSYGLVTEPQATATAVAGIDATATATEWTPTPTATLDVSATITATATPLPTPEPAAIITETLVTEGLANLQNNLEQGAGMSLDEYKQVIRARLLRDKVAEAIGEDEISPTEEQVHARHILLRIREPEPTPTELPEGAPTVEPTPTATPVPEGLPTPTPTPGPRDDAATLAFAEDLRQRIENGEDFATLAEEYSDDPGSGQNGGDLGWFGRGAMVPPFEEAAFSLPVGEISEPVKSDFGYHLIEVLERDDARPKDEATLQQERSQAFQTWLQEQMASAAIKRPDNLLNLLPAGL